MMIRALASLARGGAAGPASVCARELQSRLGFATDAQFSRKDVVNMLSNREDPDADAAIRAYMKAQFAGGKAEKAEAVFELAAQVEKKYVAAQVVEFGIQNIAVPLSAGSKDTAAIRRFASQLLALGSKAGFESPTAEVAKRVAAKAKTADSVKELLTNIKSFTSPDFHSALLEALQQVETEINGSVTLDGSSVGYKKFAEKVKTVAAAHNIPWKLLLDARAATGDDDASAKVRRDYAAYLQTAAATDAAAEVAALRTDASVLLDKHLAKTAEQVRKEQDAAMATLQKRLEGAKGAKWAQAYQEDLKSIAAFDSWRATV